MNKFLGWKVFYVIEFCSLNQVVADDFLRIKVEKEIFLYVNMLMFKVVS